MTLAQRDASAVELYRSGVPRKDVARLIGVTPQRVSQILDRRGVQRVRRCMLPRVCRVCGDSYDRADGRAHRLSRSHQVAAFWAHVDESGGPDACWPGRWAPSPSGHLQGWMDGRDGAHRIALSLSLGRPIADGLMACHRCDNPPCCNPRHLYEGTKADNARDYERSRRRLAI